MRHTYRKESRIKFNTKKVFKYLFKKIELPSQIDQNLSFLFCVPGRLELDVIDPTNNPTNPMCPSMLDSLRKIFPYRRD